jgi:hypothetical protein
LWAIGRYDLGLSEHDFWELTFEQFHALRDRHFEHIDFLEYCAVLPVQTLLQIYRKEDTEVPSLLDLMLWRQHRVGPTRETEEPAPSSGELAPPSGMRWKEPGERPPSRQKIDPLLFEPPRKANAWQMPVN